MAAVFVPCLSVIPAASYTFGNTQPLAGTCCHMIQKCSWGFFGGRGGCCIIFSLLPKGGGHFLRNKVLFQEDGAINVASTAI